MDDLLQEFLAETRETLEALSGEIVAWESDPTDRARLDAIFRFVHTVKGSCGFLDLPRLTRLSHAAEDVLAAVRDGKRVPDAPLVDAVLAIVDRIGDVVEAIDAGIGLDDSSEDLLIAALAEDAAPVAVRAAGPIVERAAGRSIRLNLELLDRMMSGMSDMVLARNELARRFREGPPDAGVEAALDRLSANVAEMRDAVTRTRMQRFEALYAPLPRMVRDVAQGIGKTVVLSTDGGDVELDREMIDMLRDPLVHIIRNSVDHGIETPAVRRSAGKADAGRLSICARQSGNQILIDIADDGAGIDVDRVAAKAIATGIVTEVQAAAMSEAARLDLVFSPGLSSRDTVTALSGRGVGMDVVRANIERVGGRVSLVNRPGRGLTIAIQVPLTLSIIATVVLAVGGQRFALPRQSIEEVVSLHGETVRIGRIGDATVAAVRGERLPVVNLAAVLGIEAGEPVLLAIVATREGRFAIAVDAVPDTEELVIKPVAPAVMASGLYAGQTLPDSGSPMLLLDAAGVAAAAGLIFSSTNETAEEQDGAATAAGTPALLFDDLDGQQRAVALAAVERVETIAAGTIAASGGRLWLAVDDRLIPVHHAGGLDVERETVVVRLTDGDREAGYAVASPIGIVSLPTAAARADIAMVDGRPVEVVDLHALFAGLDAIDAAAPVCLLHADDDGWMAGFLRPVVEAAGYRCVERLDAGETAALALAMDGAPPVGLPTIRLSPRPGSGSGLIYRYDRPALVAALTERRHGGAAA